MNKELMKDCIETKRLVLFPYTAENLRLFNEDLQAFEQMYGVKYQGEELDHLLRNFLIRLQKEIEEEPEHYLYFTEFLIVLKEDDRIIGSIDYKHIPEDGVTEVGYGIHPLHQNKGYMSEALKGFLDFGKRIGIRKVLADTRKDNIASQKVLQNCGFRFLKEEENLWWQIDL